ncbi:MAG: type II CAAX endopeptidase family protein [Pseudoxanthomonas sp.]
MTSDPATVVASPVAGNTGSLPAGVQKTLRAAVIDFACDVAIALFTLLAVMVPLGVIAALFYLVRGDAGSAGMLQGGAFLWISLLGTGCMALIVYGWRNPASRAQRAASWRAIRQPRTWGWILVVTALVFVCSNGLTALAKGLGLEAEPANLEPIRQALAASPLLMGVVVVLLAPAYEELLFRRVLFGKLWAAGWPKLGMALSGAAFAFMHEMPGTDPATWPATGLLLLVYGAMGAAFAWLYRRTGTLYAAIAAHALNNGIALLVLHWGA